MSKIWERYFLKEFLKIFFLFLFCFYGLYVIIDYASHTSALPHHTVQIQGQTFFKYYLFVFASRAEIIIPIAILLAFVKTMTSLNTRNELVALMAGGIQLKSLFRPFLLFACLMTLLIFANEEFLLPTALKKLKRIEEKTKHQKSKHAVAIAANSVILADGTSIIYQAYEQEFNRFFDVYWIESIDSIFRMKYLDPKAVPPKGYSVDHLERQSSGELMQTASFPEKQFEKIVFAPEVLQSAIFEPEILSLTELIKEAGDLSKTRTEKESRLLTALYWKLLIPFLCILAIIGPGPFCIRFSRQLPLFFIYAGSLFGFIAFYMLLDASTVVAKRQVLPPMISFAFPFLLIALFFVRRFFRHIIVRV